MDCWDKQGNLIEIEEWMKLMSDDSYKRVAYSKLNDCVISTVWTGLDNFQKLTGMPMTFETMVFPLDSFQDMDGNRYATEEEALLGHTTMLYKWALKCK